MQQVLQNLGETITGYMPGFFGGILLIIIGLTLGWLIKRIVIQLAVILRLELFFNRFRWGKDFPKGTSVTVFIVLSADWLLGSFSCFF